MSDKTNSGNLSSKDVVIRGTLIAVIVTIPSLSAFFISWYFLNDLIQAGIIGGIIHFIAMGFSLKLAKKFLIKKPSTEPDV